MSRLPLRLAGSAACAAAVTGCTDIGSEPVPEREPAALELHVDEELLVEGEETAATVRLLDAEGRPFQRLPPWLRVESSDRDVVTARDGGVVRGQGPGAAMLRARARDLEEEREVRVNPSELGVTVASVLINQAAQDLDGSVPLLAGQPGYLRVFLEGDVANFFEPEVRVRLYHDGALRETLTLEPTAAGIPERANEDVWEGSWGAPLPGHLLEPHLEAVVEVDPAGVVPLKGGGRGLRHPEEGRESFDVRELPRLPLTLVPVEQPDGSGGTIPSALHEGTADSYLPPLLGMFPVTGDADVQVREPFQVSQRATDPDSWVDGLSELRALQLAEAEDRYYYGLLRRTVGRIAGIAYLGLPVGMGHDALSEGAAVTLAHELGHNMGLRHAPCGSPGGVDEDFPQVDGSIGSAGIDVASGTLHPSRTPDVMSYCRPAWIGPYMYGEALRFRLREEPLATESSSSEPDSRHRASDPGRTGGDGERPTGEPATGSLLVFGSVRGGEVRLSPALQVDAPPALPRGEGPYLLEGLDASGRPHFRLRFRPDPVEDAGAKTGGFAFVLPPEVARPGELAELRVLGPSSAASRPSTIPVHRHRSPDAATDPAAARLDAPARSEAAALRGEPVGRGTRIRWDASRSPLIAIRDAETDRILAFGRRGEVTLPDRGRELVVDLSHGTGSEAVRLRIDGDP